MAQRGQVPRSRRGKTGARIDIGPTVFRSCWEADWARQLEFWRRAGLVKRWEYEPDSFALPFKAKPKRYLPDFKVYWAGSLVEYHEVKGVADARARRNAIGMRRFHPDVRVRRIGIDCIREMRREMAAHIPNLESSV
jgi:hypothetical protein